MRAFGVVAALLAPTASAIYFRDVVGDMVELGGADGSACVSFGFSLDSDASSPYHRELRRRNRKVDSRNLTISDGYETANFFSPASRRRMASADADEEESLATGCLPRAAKLPTNAYLDDSVSVVPVRLKTVDIQVGTQKIKLFVVEQPGSVKVFASPNEVFTTEAGTYQVPEGIIASKVTDAVAEVADVVLSFPERSCPNSRRRRLNECGARRRRKLRALAGMADFE